MTKTLPLLFLATCLLFVACDATDPQDGFTPYSSRYKPLPAEATLLQGATVLTGTGERFDDADVVIWTADPLELSSFPEAVFIGGQAIDMENRQTMLRDRYLQTDSDKPPAFRH